MTTRSYDVGTYGAAELLTLAPRHEATHVATGSGNWNDPSVWADGEVPGDGAAVLVDDGAVVTLAHETVARLETVRIDGTLTFDSTADTKLRVDTVLVSKAGNLQIGTEDAPVESGVTAEIEFVAEVPLERSNDPQQAGRGLLAAGECQIHGAPRTTWDVLDSHAEAGTTEITLTGDGPAALDDHGWQVGDEIVVPDQEPWGGVPERVADDGVEPTATHDDEIREITSVDGDVIGLGDPLEHDHVPPDDALDSYVVNLSRNVRLTSESDDTDEYGHVAMMSAGQSVRFLEAQQLGRTDKTIPASNPLWERGESSTPRHENRRARYPIHFHRTGPANEASTVQGCSIRDAPGWGAVNHGSAVDFLDNVSYDVDGCAFVTEAGGESGSFRRNFALRSVGSGHQVDAWKGWVNQHPNQMTGPPNNVDDFGHHGGGFWIHSPIVEVEQNVAAGHRAHGYEFWCRALLERPLEGEERLDGKHDMFPVLEASLLTEDERAVGRSGLGEPKIRRGDEQWHEKTDDVYFNDAQPIRTFDDNTAFGCGAGVEFRSTSFRNENPRQTWSKLVGFTAYNVGEHYLADGTPQGQHNDFESDGNVGIDHRYVGNVTHVDYTLIGTGGGIGSANNLQYTNGWDVEDSEVRGWEYGYVPKRYKDPGYNQVRDTVFDNDTDVLLERKFPRGESALYLEGNEYRGDVRLEWEQEITWDLIPRHLIDETGAVNFEGRNVYHGWCDPAFVLIEEDDPQGRLDGILNRADQWRDHLDGDDPEEVIPGATHRELYETYGITFYGGILDPDAGEQPDDFVGSGGTFDSTPYLGTGPKTQPCDEIWIDAVEAMNHWGDYEIVSYDDGDAIENHEPLEVATDGTALQLNAEGRGHEDPPAGQDEQGFAGYTFEIDRTGPYQVFLRATIGAEDWGYRDIYAYLFYIRIDGGDWVELGGDSGGPPARDQLVWSRNHPRYFELTETGEHTIEIAGQGQKMRIDRVLVCHETVAAAPIGDGKSQTPTS